MTDRMNAPDMPSKGRWQLVVFGAVLGVIGLILLVRGATLMALGGSWYYGIAGALLLTSGVLLHMRRLAAAWVYALVFVGTVLWALWEVGLSFWPLVPRLAPVLVLAFIFALCFPLLRGRQTRRASYAVAGVLLLGIVVGAAFMFQPHGVVRQPLANLTLAAAPVDDNDNWQYYGRSPRGTRFAPDQRINRDNVADLQVAWTFRTGEITDARSAFQNTPIQIGDTLYICTPLNKVFALDAETGEERWRFDPQTTGPKIYNRCRGVAYYEPAARYATEASDDGTCAQRVVLTTIDARLMQLDARTGQPCTSFGNNGTVNLTMDMGEVKPGFYYQTSMPTIIRNRILIGGWVWDGREVGEPSGVVRTFDADTGALVWAWDLGNPDVTGAPPPEGYSRGTPNMWSTPAFDDALGLVYLPLGNGTPDFWGAHRSQATNDYASSVVALDIETGRERWKFQTVHIDTWDYDIGTQPALYDLPDGKGGTIPALIQATKIGQIFVLDRRDGTPVFPVEEKSTPRGHQPGNTFADTQPFSVGMPAFGGNTLTEADMWGATFFDQLECRIAFKRMNYRGIYTPIVTDIPTIIYPGYLGGMNWGSVAVDETRGLLIVNDIRIPQLALHMPQGTTLTREALAQLGIANGGSHVQAGTPYSTFLGIFYSGLGIPCHAPPWGVIAAIDLRTGALVWQRPAGSIEDEVLMGVRVKAPMPVGLPTLGGPLATASGLVFHAGTRDYYLRAYDVETGDELWKGRLPVGGQATPMTYTLPASGRQFVVIAAGGVRYSPDSGDYVIAYALPH